MSAVVTVWSACRSDRAASRTMLRTLLPAVPAPLGEPEFAPEVGAEDGCDLLDLAGTGLIDLTGHRGMPPAVPGAPVFSRIRAVADLIDELRAQLAPSGSPPLDLPRVLTGRAAEMGSTRGGRVSANGSCRLLDSASGRLAINLARPGDLDLVPAIAEAGADADPWVALTEAARRLDAVALAERVQMFGVPAAALDTLPPELDPAVPFTVRVLGQPRSGPSTEHSVIADLSSMWAGPLCARVLADLGARVLKVEDPGRPDGARFGPPVFYAWLHRDPEEVAVGLRDPAGLARLHEVLDRGDVVIESSRPRALAQAGIDAQEWVGRAPGRTWVSITGYGRWSSWSNRVAFGDDAAVAGGLVGTDAAGEPVFLGDAMADPVTGLIAGLAAAASIRAGGGHLIDVPMAAAAAFVARPATGTPVAHELTLVDGAWWMRHGDNSVRVMAPVC